MKKYNVSSVSLFSEIFIDGRSYTAIVLANSKALESIEIFSNHIIITSVLGTKILVPFENIRSLNVS